MEGKKDILGELIKDYVSSIKEPVLLWCCKEIDTNQLITFNKALRNKKFKKLNLVLQTPWWDPSVAYKIIRLLRNKCESLNIYVPWYAKSAGTLICLWANKIYLSSIGELWPLDVQLQIKKWQQIIELKSALEEFQALEQIKESNVKVLDSVIQLLLRRLANGVPINNLLSAANEHVAVTSWKLYNSVDAKKLWEYSRALNIWFLYWVKILTTWWWKTPDEANAIMNNLVYSYPTHWFVIDHIDWNSFNLPIEYDDKNNFIEDLSESFIEQSVQNFDKIELYDYN